MKLLLSSNVGEACSASHNVGNVGEAIIHNLGERAQLYKETIFNYNFSSSGDERDSKKE